jgi:hypothetical protein
MSLSGVRWKDGESQEKYCSGASLATSKARLIEAKSIICLFFVIFKLVFAIFSANEYVYNIIDEALSSLITIP